MKAAITQAPQNIEMCTTIACISPCSQGALRQHYFQADTLPTSANFYLALTEDYQRAIHHDEAPQTSRYKSSQKVVHERVSRILRYKNRKFSDAVIMPMRFLVESDDYSDRIELELHYSEDDLKEHSALKNADGSLRAGIRSYPVISVDLADLSANGFHKKSGNGKKHFEVRTYVKMTGTSDKLEIKIDIMQPNYRFPEEREGHPYSKDDVLWTFKRELWNKSMSHFVRDISGTATPAAAPAGPAIPQNPTNKRKAAASAGNSHKNTSMRAVRQRVINYADDEDEDME
jgi:hypothetical protein